MSKCYSIVSTPRFASALVQALAIFVVLVAMCETAAAQSPVSSYGRKFFVAFPDTVQNRLRVLFNSLETTAQLTLVSVDTARVTVTGPGFSRSVTVEPGRSTTVMLTDAFAPATSIFVDSVGVPQNLSFRIEADRPVAVTAYYATIFGAEAFTPLPVELWGTEYFAASLNQLWVYNAAQIEEINTVAPAPSSLIVVSGEDGTDVTIETTTDVVGPKLRTVRLDLGEVYLVETYPWTDATKIGVPDISGTRITSTKPVGVLSGNTRTLGSLLNPLPREPLPWNAMANSAYEWLHPTSAHGHTFVYRQFSAVEERTTTEIVRVYGTSPGITTVTITNGGPPMTMPQGGYIDFPTTVYRNDSLPQPFAVRTDKPAQCFVFTGSYSKYLGSYPDSIEMETSTWSPAMAELVPRERWITLARYNAPVYPGGTSHYVVVAADSGTTVILDGDPIAFEARPVTGTTYRHARVAVAPGDHTLRSVGGRFTATAFGQRRGYEAYRPPAVNGDRGDIDGINVHPTYYLEILSLAYAMPIPGISDLVVPLDSLVITRNDRCDSSVVIANRASVTWSSNIIDATVDPSGVNVDVVIDKTFINRLHRGFRIRFKPIDDTRDASGSVTVTNESGQRWTIPYVYSAATVALAPDQVDLLAIGVGELRVIPLRLTNKKPFTTTVLDARLRHGDRGFVLQGRSTMPKPLAAGGSFALTLEFIGTSAGTLYTDTLVIYSDCDSMVVPLNARTAPPAPAPVPLITGYDWQTRRVGSVNDTLSFVSNAGTLPFTIAQIIIVNDAAGAFSVVAPSAATQVGPAERMNVSIRFLPPTSGQFSAEILLVTVDGDSARATLQGNALLARIDLSDFGPVDLCMGREIDSLLTLSASGAIASRIDSFVVRSTANVRVEIDSASLSLPRTLVPGQSMYPRVRIVALAPGAFSVTIVAVANAVGDSVADISGVITACADLGIVATDHDFDTVLIAHVKSGQASLINTGDADVTVTAMRIVDDAARTFGVTAPLVPFVVALGDTVAVDVAFVPPALGLFTARVEYETSAGIVHSQLRGVGSNVIVPASIPRYYRGEPGQEKIFSVRLGRSVDVVGASPILVTVGYDTTLLDFVSLRDTAADQVGLRLISALRGVVTFELSPRVDTLRQGSIAALRFLVRIALDDSSELPLTMSSSTPWIEFQTAPGLFVRIPWCGLAQRLFEFTDGTLTLRPVRPNPVRASATVEFGVPVDGHVTLIVVDARGNERQRLVDIDMQAGEYEAMLDAGGLSRGAYMLRLRTSGLERIVRFVVE